MADAPLLDRAFLEKLERLTIQWQKSLPGLVGGHNTSRFAGRGPGVSGSSPVSITATICARSTGAPYLRLEKLFLKMFQLEPRIPVRMLVDISESMTGARAASSSTTRASWRRRCATWGWCGWIRSSCSPSSAGCVQRVFPPAADGIVSSGVMDVLIGRCRRPAPTDFLAWCAEFIGAIRSAAW